MTTAHDLPRSTRGRRSLGGDAARAEAPEQLTLLPPSDLPLQFRLDDRTRLRGLANIAQIRRQLAERATERDAAARPVPQRRRAA